MSKCDLECLMVRCVKCGDLIAESTSYKRYDPELGKSSVYCPKCSGWARKMKEKYGH